MPGLLIKYNLLKNIVSPQRYFDKVRNAYKVKNLSYSEKTCTTKNSLFYTLYPKFIKVKRIEEFNNKKYVVLLDGDYYNDDELKLKYKLTSSNKLELLLDLYLTYGDSFADNINGEFNIIICDNIKEKLIVTNDRFARRALFWYKDDDSFILASEKKGIISVINESMSINSIGLIELFLYRHNLNGKTFISEIHKLKPASYLVIKKEKIEFNSYFSWNFQYNQNAFNRLERINDIANTLTNGLTKRIYDKKRILLWLSAGYDSRAIACFIPEKYRDNIITETYGDISSDEVSIAKEISKVLSYKWRSFEVEGGYLDIAKIGSWRSEFALPALDHPFVKRHKDIKTVADYIIQGVPGLNEINSGHLRMGKIIASLKPDTYNQYFNIYSKDTKLFSFLFRREFFEENFNKARNDFLALFNRDTNSYKLYKWDTFNLSQRQPNYSHMADLVENDLFETLHPFTDVDFISLFTQIPIKDKLFLQITKDLLYQKCPDLRHIPFGNGRGILKSRNNILNAFYGELKAILLPQSQSIIWNKKKALDNDYEIVKIFILDSFNNFEPLKQIFNYSNIVQFVEDKKRFIDSYWLVDILITFLIAYGYFLSGKDIITPEIIETNYK